MKFPSLSGAARFSFHKFSWWLFVQIKCAAYIFTSNMRVQPCLINSGYEKQAENLPVNYGKESESFVGKSIICEGKYADAVLKIFF